MNSTFMKSTRTNMNTNSNINLNTKSNYYTESINYDEENKNTLLKDKINNNFRLTEKNMSIFSNLLSYNQKGNENSNLKTQINFNANNNFLNNGDISNRNSIFFSPYTTNRLKIFSFSDTEFNKNTEDNNYNASNKNNNNNKNSIRYKERERSEKIDKDYGDFIENLKIKSETYKKMYFKELNKKSEYKAMSRKKHLEENKKNAKKEITRLMDRKNKYQ
jgi:hypothetical protein